MQQLIASHQAQVNDLRSEGLANLDDQVTALEKTINNKNIELKATQDDLAKAKAALSATAPEIDALRQQLEEAKAATSSIATTVAAEHNTEIQRLLKELSDTRDDVTATHEVLAATNDSIQLMSQKHSEELEESAKARAEEVLRLRSAHDQEVAKLNQEKAALTARVSDLQGEMANLQASAAAAAELQSSQKRNGLGHSSTTEVSKEELQKLHEAHNLKMHDLRAEHDKAAKSLKDDLELARAEAGEMRNSIEGKNMEMSFMQQEIDEKDDTITRYVKHLKVIFSSRGPLYRFGRACAYLKTLAT